MNLTAKIRDIVKEGEKRHTTPTDTPPEQKSAFKHEIVGDQLLNQVLNMKQLEIEEEFNLERLQIEQDGNMEKSKF